MNRAARRALSRRELLRRSGALVVVGMTPAMLAACGGDDDETTTSSAAPEATSTTAAEPAAPPASGTIDFLSWEGYDIPGPMKPWKTENSVDVKPTYIANHDEIQTKLKAGGGGGYDLITYYQGYKPLYTELDILTALDDGKLPNVAGLFPYFAGKEKNSGSTRTAPGRAYRGRGARSGSPTTRRRPTSSPPGTTCSTPSSRARSPWSTIRRAIWR